MLLALDPGRVRTGWALFSEGEFHSCGVLRNQNSPGRKRRAHRTNAFALEVEGFIAAYFDSITHAVVEVQGSWRGPISLDFPVRSREYGMWYPATFFVRELIRRGIPTFGVDATVVYRFFREQWSYPQEDLANSVKDELALNFAHLVSEKLGTDHLSAIALGLYFIENQLSWVKEPEQVAV